MKKHLPASVDLKTAISLAVLIGLSLAAAVLALMVKAH